MQHPALPYRAGWPVPAADKKKADAAQQGNPIERFFDHLGAGDMDQARAQMSENRRLAIAEGADGWTALFFAVRWDEAQAAEHFALLGCDVNHADDNGMTPLILAAMAGSLGCVETLLRFDGIDINAQCVTGATALSTALELGCNSIARVLMKHGASILIGEEGKTPLDLAFHGDHVPRDLGAVITQRYRTLN